MKGKGRKAMNVMNGVGSPAIEAAKKTSSSGFKRGGAIPAKKLKTGGKVGGAAAPVRLDKRARGGRMGGSPFSSAKSQSMRGNSSGNDGHESTGGKGDTTA